MKTKLYMKAAARVGLCILMTMAVRSTTAQNAVMSTPIGIGKNCGGAASTDSLRVLNYNDITNTLSVGYKCKPIVGGGTPPGPAFSSNSGSVAFNPKNQEVYYIPTSNGNNSFVYHWLPNTCPAPTLGYSNYYNNQFVVGLDFEPTTGDGYQLEFTGSSAPYNCFLRKVNFATNTFGTSVPITLTAGAKIYQQRGDIIFTPAGQLYIAFDDKIFKVDYSNYGSGTVIGNYIDSLRFGGGYHLTGIAYAQGKFLGSCQSGSSSCYFKEIDISTGSAVLTSVTLASNNYTALDMATLINGVGVAEKIFSVAQWTVNKWIVKYDIKIRNYGNSILNNVQLVTNMGAVFGGVFTSATVAAVGTLPSGLTLNPSYDGSTNSNIFVGGVASKLNTSPADSATVRVTVVLTNPLINNTYLSTSMGSGNDNLFGAGVSDSSNNDGALRSDLNSNGIPDDANEDIPTPLRITDWIFLANNIVDFNGAYGDNNANLKWSLQNTESGLTAYVERSNDRVNFQRIGSMDIKGSSQITNYTWVDKNLSANDNYYRLEFVRPDGSNFYSAIISVSPKNINPIKLTASPNPFRDRVTFSINLNRTGMIFYKLLDFQSHVVAKGEKLAQTGDNKITIDNTSNIPTGTYLLQVTVGENNYQKVIIKTP